MNRWWISACMMTAVATMAIGQATQPAESPAVAMVESVWAMMRGDEAAMAQRMVADGQEAQQLLEEMKQTTRAAGRLRAMLMERLGEEATSEVYKSPKLPIPSETMKNLQEQIEGEVAKVSTTGGHELAELRLEDGQWRVSLDAMLRQMQAMGVSMEQMTAVNRKQAAGFDAVAERVKRGELTSVDAVVDAMLSIFRSEGEVKAGDVDPADGNP